MKLLVLSAFAFSGIALASLSDEMGGLEKRGAVLTGQTASESEDNERFILENNLWGQADATSGEQSSQVTAIKGDTITWQTKYTWVGGPSKVKSYANIDVRVGLGKSLSSITSIPTSWSWTYTSASSDLVADVSYDTWLSEEAKSSGASGASTFEIMIWLSSRGGARPAGSQIATASVNNVEWALYKGSVGSWTVFSFAAPSEITNFNSDLKPFFDYLISKEGVPSSQFLVQAQAGTEPFVGSATLTTNAYSISIN